MTALQGGDGHDFLVGNVGLETIIGGAGNDTAIIQDGDVNMGRGDDHVATNYSSRVSISLGAGHDSVNYQAGADGFINYVAITDLQADDSIYAAGGPQSETIAFTAFDLDSNGRLDAIDGSLLVNPDVQLIVVDNQLTFGFGDGEGWDELALGRSSVPLDFLV